MEWKTELIVSVFLSKDLSKISLDKVKEDMHMEGLIISLILCLLTGWMIGREARDYSISLIDDYEVWWINSRDILIGQKFGKFRLAHTIPTKMLKVRYWWSIYCGSHSALWRIDRSNRRWDDTSLLHHWYRDWWC